MISNDSLGTLILFMAMYRTKATTRIYFTSFEYKEFETTMLNLKSL